MMILQYIEDKKDDGAGGDAGNVVACKIVLEKIRWCVPQVKPSNEIKYSLIKEIENKQEGHDGPVLLHSLLHEIHSYQTLHYLGIGLKHKTPYKD